MSAAIDPAPLPAPPLRQRRWIPVVTLAAVLAAVTTGGYLTSDALGEIRGGAVAVGTSVRITPFPGWELARRSTDPDRIRLTSGSTSLDVAAFTFDGTDVDLLGRYVDEVLQPEVRRQASERQGADVVGAHDVGEDVRNDTLPGPGRAHDQRDLLKARVRR